jgi:hypothetical protein
MVGWRQEEFIELVEFVEFAETGDTIETQWRYSRDAMEAVRWFDG